MIVSARLPIMSRLPRPSGFSRLVAWLHRREQARRRRRETMTLMHMTDHLRRDMGLQDYQITQRRR